MWKKWLMCKSDTLHYSLRWKSNLSTLTHYCSSPLVSLPAEEAECLLLLSDILDWFRPVFRLKTHFTVAACSLSSLLQLVTCASSRVRWAPWFCSLPDLWPLSAGLLIKYKIKSKSFSKSYIIILQLTEICLVRLHGILIPWAHFCGLQKLPDWSRFIFQLLLFFSVFV